MGQYFTNDEHIKSEKRLVETTIFNQKYSFISDNGVFSKNGVDYGSMALLKIIDPLINQGKLIDIGCGYGPIGLILAKNHPTLNVEMVDINLRAISLALENQKLFNVDNVRIYQSDLFEKVDGEFDYIVTNPPIRAGKKVVYAIFQQAWAHLHKQGALYFVIRKDQGAFSAQKYVSELFQNCELLKRDKGYYIYRAVKS